MNTNAAEHFPLLPCFSCNHPLELHQDSFSDYFFHSQNICPYCQGEDYLWFSALRSLKEEIFPSHVAILIGALLKAFRIDLARNQIKEVAFKQYGIPEHSHILNINFTPLGVSLFPTILFHGNEVLPFSKVPSTIQIYGRPLQREASLEMDATSTTAINVMVLYSTHSEDEYPLSRLFSAYQSYLQQDYGLMGHDAHSVIEYTLNGLIEDFEKRVGLSKLGLSYEENLKRRLNEVGKYYQAPLLGDLFTKYLLMLYKNVRIKRTHTTTPISSTKEEAAEFLCAAIFAYQYMMSLKQRIFQV